MPIKKSGKLPLAHRINVLKKEGAYEVLTKAAVLEARGKKIIHLEIGQSDFPTPKNITNAGIYALKKGFTKYTSPLGILTLRKKISQSINISRHLSITEKNIAVTPSGKTAIFAAMSAVLEKGDEVIYPNPGFPTYETLIDYFDCRKKPVPLLEEKNFGFDMRAFRQAFSPKTKLVILNSPSNPSGAILPLKTLQEISELTSQSRSYILTDEMYSKFIYDNQIYPSFYGLKNVQNRTILVDGFSKTYSMTGWRIGYLAAPEKLIEKMDSLLTHFVGCTATFTQYAALEALTGPQDQVKKMVKEFQKRRDFLVTSLNQIKGVSCLKPPGAFYVFANVKSFRKSSASLANYLLDKAGVALLAGACFGKSGEGYLRISYATSMTNLEKAIKKLKIAFNKLKI